MLTKLILYVICTNDGHESKPCQLLKQKLRQQHQAADAHTNSVHKQRNSNHFHTHPFRWICMRWDIEQNCICPRLRRPVRLLQCPHWASLPRPGGCPLVFHTAGRAGTGFSCRSGGCELPSSGDWASGNPAFAISRGSPAAPSLTTGPGPRLAGMLRSPSPSGIQVSHQTREPPSEFTPAEPGMRQGASWRTGIFRPCPGSGGGPASRSSA